MSDDGELLSVVDDGGRRLPGAGRREVHEQGWWHESFHCLFVRSSPPVRVLLQRRRAGASRFAGLLDLTVTGHVRDGEAPTGGGVREIEEELGLAVAPERLVALGTRRIVDASGGVVNREVAHVFVCVDDTPLERFRIADADVEGLVELTAEDLLALLGPAAAASRTGRELHRDGRVEVVRCTAEDLTPQLDGYWTVLVVMAERHVAGLGPLAI